MKIKLKGILFILNQLILIVFFFLPQISWAADVKYTYDALGRLTFVEDNVSGNRDYDYDDAGNRLKVSQGNSDDSDSEPGATPALTIAEPTGLQCDSYYWGSYRARWGSVPNASYYIVQLSKEFTTTSTEQIGSTKYGSSCHYSVAACLSNNVCSGWVSY